MKIALRLVMGIAVVAIAISCLKVEPTPQYSSSKTTFSATASATTVAAAAKDSLSPALSFTWNDPKFPVGLAQSKFTIRVCATGNNFLNFQTKSFSSVLTGSLLGTELNTIALKLGGAVGNPTKLDFKVVASQANNNDPVESAVTTVTVTPYGDLDLSSASTTIVTAALTAGNVGTTLSWNAGFKGYEGTRTYELQYVKGGSSFTVHSVSSVSGLSKSFTQLQLNNIAALEFGVPSGTAGTVDFRLKVTNGAGASIYSNTVTLSITPYLSPPIYAMGDGLKGWGPWPDNEVIFSYTGPQTYQTVAKLTSGKSFRFFAQEDYNPTSYAFPYFTTVDPQLVNANDGDSNLKFTGTTGFFTITVNLGSKTVTLATASEPLLYVTGAGFGWVAPGSLGTKMQYLNPGVFRTTFKITTGDIFRFFPQADWNPSSYHPIDFTTVDANFTDDGGGDHNFKFNGTTGFFAITVDLTKKTMTAVSVPEPVLYVTGSGFSWNTPGSGASVKLTNIGPGLFRTNAVISPADVFRFFPQADWNPTSYGINFFGTVDANFVDDNGGDHNFKFTGASAGYFTITVDLVNKIMTIAEVPLYVTGSPFGWTKPGDPGSLKATFVSPGVYDATITLAPTDAFRFFPQADWNPTSYGFNYFTTVDSNFVDDNGGDHNFKFTGIAGTYKIEVNLNNKTFVLK